MDIGLNSARSNSVSTDQWLDGTRCDYRQGARQTAHDQNPYHIFQTISICTDVAPLRDFGSTASSLL